MEFYRCFRQNSSKSFHLRPLYSLKHWFFKNISENVSNFRQIFSRKFGPIEQHKTQISENSFLKSNKTLVLGSQRATHSAKILGTPPPSKIPLILIYSPIYSLEGSIWEGFFGSGHFSILPNLADIGHFSPKMSQNHVKLAFFARKGQFSKFSAPKASKIGHFSICPPPYGWAPPPQSITDSLICSSFMLRRNAFSASINIFLLLPTICNYNWVTSVRKFIVDSSLSDSEDSISFSLEPKRLQSFSVIACRNTL